MKKLGAGEQMYEWMGRHPIAASVLIVALVVLIFVLFLCVTGYCKFVDITRLQRGFDEESG